LWILLNFITSKVSSFASELLLQLVLTLIQRASMVY
jgi:hypothetical protein